MTPEEYTLLYEKYIAGHCSMEEVEQLTTYRDQLTIQDPDRKLSAEERALKNRVYRRIDQTLHNRFDKNNKVISFKRYLQLAAAILLIGITTGIIFLKYARLREPTLVKANMHTIKPGRNTAILTLANGKKISLDDTKDGTLATTGKTVIKKIKNGQIVYDSASQSAASDAAMNTITTPRGGQYNITLADGTRVWLNSVSSLTYPASFSGKKRMVELKGEGYFEVAHNEKMPFSVKANGAVIEVLGTHFNVSAYEGESFVKTTLLEGSVRLSSKANAVKLSPGQQGITNDKVDNIEIKNVKIAEVVAWKNGSFVFTHSNIQEIMKQISRWYDVDVEYRGDLTNRYFGGTYSKYKDITELLNGLELTGLIHFKIEGRRIIAMP